MDDLSADRSGSSSSSCHSPKTGRRSDLQGSVCVEDPRPGERFRSTSTRSLPATRYGGGAFLIAVRAAGFPRTRSLNAIAAGGTSGRRSWVQASNTFALRNPLCWYSAFACSKSIALRHRRGSVSRLRAAGLAEPPSLAFAAEELLNNEGLAEGLTGAGFELDQPCVFSMATGVSALSDEGSGLRATLKFTSGVPQSGRQFSDCGEPVARTFLLSAAPPLSRWPNGRRRGVSPSFAF